MGSLGRPWRFLGVSGRSLGSLGGPWGVPEVPWEVPGVSLEALGGIEGRSPGAPWRLDLVHRLRQNSGNVKPHGPLAELQGPPQEPPQSVPEDLGRIFRASLFLWLVRVWGGAPSRLIRDPFGVFFVTLVGVLCVSFWKVLYMFLKI